MIGVEEGTGGAEMDAARRRRSYGRENMVKQNYSCQESYMVATFLAGSSALVVHVATAAIAPTQELPRT